MGVGLGDDVVSVLSNGLRHIEVLRVLRFPALHPFHPLVSSNTRRTALHEATVRPVAVMLPRTLPCSFHPKHLCVLLLFISKCESRVSTLWHYGDEHLRLAVQYFQTRLAREVISFQCSTSDKMSLARKASTESLAVHFRTIDDVPHRHEETHFNRIGVFIDAGCPGFLRALSDKPPSFFNSSFAVFVWDPRRAPAEGTGLFYLADTLALAVDTQLAMFAPYLPVALDVYKVDYDLPLVVEPLRLVPSRRHNFTGLTVRAVGEAIRGTEPGWNQFPLYLEGFIRDDDPADIFKQGPRLFDLMRELYNFTFAMRTVDGGGQPMANGSCSGLPGLLKRGDFDFGLQMWMDEDRVQCVQFIAYNLVTFDTALVYRMPTRSSSALNSMVTPFSSGSWAGVFVMFGMMALLLLIADEFRLEEAFGNLGPWSAALIFGTAGISWGSVHYGINSTHLISVELGTVVGGLTYTVIFTYYQSSVVFGLLAKDSRPPLSPQEVLQEGYRVVSDDFSYFKDLFETSENPDVQDIRRRHLDSDTSPGFVSLSTGAHMLKNEKVALVGDSTAVAKQLNPIMTSQQLCSVRYSRIDSDRSLLFSAARKGWPLSDHMKRGLLMALERGLSRRIVRPFRMPCSTDDSTATQTTISALTVTAATTAYVVLTAGYVLCGSLCALETVGPALERTLDRFVATRRLSVLFARRRTRRWSRLSAASPAFYRRRTHRWSRGRPSLPSVSPVSGKHHGDMLVLILALLLTNQWLCTAKNSNRPRLFQPTRLILEVTKMEPCDEPENGIVFFNVRAGMISKVDFVVNADFNVTRPAKMVDSVSSLHN
ncbi:Glutamate receptor ionotropic, kainate glr-3 [Frankliniella fusca]|uniref:Glutamate receptor ionotropic, kainate glr-3 n=1 Tax=Frankliniella fusca TaxID=407009 RepID=A0AAE1H5X9_9NEOP|nr:Glutamate receptor ionotropic, kainate glr-3 [Frankliniella fusca]